jgi:hypothetical protein
MHPSRSWLYPEYVVDRENEGLDGVEFGGDGGR